MTFQEFIAAYDKEGFIVLLEGKRAVLTADAPFLTALGKQLAESTHRMRFRSGNAPGPMPSSPQAWRPLHRSALN